MRRAELSSGLAPNETPLAPHSQPYANASAIAKQRAKFNIVPPSCRILLLLLDGNMVCFAAPLHAYSLRHC